MLYGGELNNKLGLVQVTLSICISILSKSYWTHGTCTKEREFIFIYSMPNHFQWRIEEKKKKKKPITGCDPDKDSHTSHHCCISLDAAYLS